MNKTFLIGEIGLNANGDINIAKNLIDIAKDCGLNAIKFQKRTIDLVYSKEELDKYRESPWGTTNREQKLGLEFGKIEYDEINRYCKEKSMIWFASPWDLESVEFLKQYNPEYWKIPSARLGHEILLTEIAKLGKYTFISSGMAEIEEIGKAINIFKKYDCPFELMYCNSQYPLADEDANLLCIRTLRHTFNCKVGYSDHCPGLITSVIAVVLGATSLEKHITINRTIYGTDQSASVEPNGLHKLVEYIRVTEEALGNGKKSISEAEKIIKNKLWRIEDVKRNI